MFIYYFLQPPYTFALTTINEAKSNAAYLSSLRCPEPPDNSNVKSAFKATRLDRFWIRGHRLRNERHVLGLFIVYNNKLR